MKERETKAKSIGYLARHRDVWGLIHEGRAMHVMQTLVDEGIFYRVKRATRKQNRTKGVDLWVYPQSEDYRIPMQVKSSVRGINEFKRFHRGAEGIAILIVNEHLGDKRIREEAIKAVNVIMLRDGM